MSVFPVGLYLPQCGVAAFQRVGGSIGPGVYGFTKTLQETPFTLIGTS